MTKIICYFASLHICKLSKIRKDAVCFIYNNDMNVKAVIAGQYKTLDPNA